MLRDDHPFEAGLGLWLRPLLVASVILAVALMICYRVLTYENPLIGELRQRGVFVSRGSVQAAGADDSDLGRRKGRIHQIQARYMRLDNSAEKQGQACPAGG